MNTEQQVPGAEVEIKEIWATPGKRPRFKLLGRQFYKRALTLDELIKEMDEVGNKVITIDRENNRLGLVI